MGPLSSDIFSIALALTLLVVPTEVAAERRSKKSYYYANPDYNRNWYYPWPDNFHRRSYSSWEEPYDESWLPWKSYK